MRSSFVFSYGCDLIQINRRQWLATAGLLVGTACRPRKGTGFPGYALISNAGDSSLAVVDLTEFRLAHALPLGSPASDIVAARPGVTFVLTPGNGTVHAVDGSLRVATSRKFSDHLSALCLSPDRSVLLATNPAARELLVIDATSLRLRSKHKLPAEPAEVAVPPPQLKGEAPKPPYVAISTGDNASAELIDYATGKSWHHEFSGPIGKLRFRADGQRLLVANVHERCITALTTPDLQTIVDLPLSMEPENLCFNADQGQMFVTGPGMDAVAIIFPYNPLDVDQTVLAGRDPGVMACSENPSFLFVGSASGSDVCILSIDSRAVIGIVGAGQQPTYITVTPGSQYALVLSESAGTMAVIHIPEVLSNFGNAAKKRNKITAGLFTLFPVGDRPLQATVVPRSA